MTISSTTSFSLKVFRGGWDTRVISACPWEREAPLRLRRAGHSWAAKAISHLSLVALSSLYGRKKLIRCGMDLQPCAENSRSSLGTYSIALATSSSVASSTSMPRAAKASRAHNLMWRNSRGRNGTKKSIRWPDIRSLWAKPPGEEDCWRKSQVSAHRRQIIKQTRRRSATHLETPSSRPWVDAPSPPCQYPRDFDQSAKNPGRRHWSSLRRCCCAETTCPSRNVSALNANNSWMYQLSNISWSESAKVVNDHRYLQCNTRAASTLDFKTSWNPCSQGWGAWLDYFSTQLTWGRGRWPHDSSLRLRCHSGPCRVWWRRSGPSEASQPRQRWTKSGCSAAPSLWWPPATGPRNSKEVCFVCLFPFKMTVFFYCTVHFEVCAQMKTVLFCF